MEPKKYNNNKRMYKRAHVFVLVLMVLTYSLFAQKYGYTYTPELKTYGESTSGTVSTFKLNYADCSLVGQDFASYKKGIFKAALWERDSLTGNMTFVVRKCSGHIENGTTGKVVLIDHAANAVQCNNFSITNGNTDSLFSTFIGNGNFDEIRHFEIVVLLANDTTLNYAGNFYVEGKILAGPPKVTVLVPIREGNDLYLPAEFDPNGAETHWRFEKIGFSPNARFGTIHATAGMHIEFDYATMYDDVCRYRAVATNEYGTTYSEWEYYYRKDINMSSTQCYCDTLTTLTEPTGTFSDKSMFNNYHANSNCKWLISPGPYRISLTFAEFDVHPSDHVYVYDGSTTNDPMIADYTGNTLPASLLSTGNTLLVRFVSDNEGNASGWTAFYNTIESTWDCQFSDCNSTECGDSTTYSDLEVFTAIDYLCSNGIVKGPGNNLVKPDDLIKRGELAKTALFGLYHGEHMVPAALVSDYFPSIYVDLQNRNTFYYRAAKALLYLEYGDGISPFDRNRTSFNPEGNIAKYAVLKVLCETFNIPKETNSSSNPFPYFSPSDNGWGYAKKAYDLGIVTDLSIQPNDYCTRAEAFVWIYRILTNSAITIPTPVNDYSTQSSFFIPVKMEPENSNQAQGIEQGNFEYSEKCCFSIPGYAPLDFFVAYNSYLTEMPSDYYLLEPLGKAWTHTYNYYMHTITNPYTSELVYVFHIQKGSLLMYEQDTTGQFVSITKGNYNSLSHPSSDVFVLTTKRGKKYTFNKLMATREIYYLTSIVDHNNNGTFITYENAVETGVKRIQKVTALGRELSFTYHSGSDLISTVSDPIGRSVHFQYTAQQLTQFTDAKGNTTSYQYSSEEGSSNLMTHIVLPRGNIIDNTYQQRKLTSSSNGPDAITTITQNRNYASQSGSYATSTVSTVSNGMVVNANYKIDKNGQTTGFNNENTNISAEYNDPNNPTLPTLVTDLLNGIATQYSYDSNGNLIKRIIYRVDFNYVTYGPYQSISNETFTYDSLNNPTTHKDFNGNWYYYYYNGRNLTRIKDPSGRVITLDYNSHGSPISISDISGLSAFFSYDNYGKIIQTRMPVLGLSISKTYDMVGRLLTVTNAKGQTVSYTYDANDNMLSETDAMGNTTQFQYDANDNRTSIINAKGYPTTFTYDDNDLLSSTTFIGQTESYTYNFNGSLHTKTDPNGVTTTFNYNSAGNLLSDGYAQYAYNERGQLASVTKDNKSLIFLYDPMGNISSVTYDGQTIEYTYDRMSNVTDIIYPSGNQVRYSYDKLNRVTSIRVAEDQYFHPLREVSYQYLPSGKLDFSRIKLNNFIIKTQYRYDEIGRMIGKCSRLNNGMGDTLVSYSNELDEVGNHLSESVKEPYDPYTSFSPGITSYTYDNANRLLAYDTVSFTYDNNGNTLSKGGRTYTYDLSNRLTSVQGDFNATYTYDGLGNRRSITHNGLTTKYVVDVLNNSQMVMKIDSSSDEELVTYYVNGPDGLVYQCRENINYYDIYVYNQRGDVVACIGNDGVLKFKCQYDEFGNILQKEDQINNPFGFMGQYSCITDTNDLVYARARYYDPTIGRFLSNDPIWSTNRYVYTNNNPITRVDPSGKSWEVFGRETLGILDEIFVELGNLEKTIEIAPLSSSMPSAGSLASELASAEAGFQGAVQNAVSSFGAELSNLASSTNSMASVGQSVASELSSLKESITPAAPAAVQSLSAVAPVAGWVAVAAAGAALCGYMFYHTIIKNDMDDVLDRWAKNIRDNRNKKRAMKGKSYDNSPTLYDPYPNYYDKNGNAYNYYL